MGARSTSAGDRGSFLNERIVQLNKLWQVFAHVLGVAHLLDDGEAVLENVVTLVVVAPWLDTDYVIYSKYLG